MILAGIDEAGYGPTLGPLVVSMTFFRVPEGTGPAELWQRLERSVCRKPDGRRVPVDDSKRLYQSKKGLRHLEEGILPWVALQESDEVRSLRGLIKRLVLPEGKGNAPPDSYLEQYPWYRRRDVDIPLDTYASAVSARAERLGECLHENGIEFLGLRTRPVEVAEFNEALTTERNKAGVPFRTIVRFLRGLWREFADESVHLVVDRQGGRRYYAPLLFNAVRPRSLRVERQERDTSTYELVRGRASASAESPRATPSTFRVVFTKGGDSKSFAVALASMLSKYLREVHMRLFNSFWHERQRDLAPTAGYALDARRFLRETDGLRRNLGIDDGLLIRNS